MPKLKTMQIQEELLQAANHISDASLDSAIHVSEEIADELDSINSRLLKVVEKLKNIAK